MKRKVLPLILSYCFCISNSYALSDTEYKEMLNYSSNYANADARLRQVWKNLSSALKNQGMDYELRGKNPQSLLAQQKKWVKSGRDIEARNYINQGYNRADAYANATLNRASYLEQILNNLDNYKFNFEQSKSNSWQSAYKKIAQDFIYHHKLPNTELLEMEDDDFFKFSENSLAIADIDNDGTPELLIRFDQTGMVAKREFAYSFDHKTKRVFEKFEGFPEIEYWTSGCARDPFSHNHGLSGVNRKDNFWPSTYYKFNSISKKYEELAVVDSWSFWEYPTNIYDNNKPFPKELDIVGDGYLYLIGKSKGNDEQLVDTPIYKKFVQKCIQNGSVIKPKWVKANKKGLQQLFF